MGSLGNSKNLLHLLFSNPEHTMKHTSFSRRKFIKTAAVGTAALGVPTIIPASAFGANDRVRVAVIGINGRGKDHISGFSKQENVEVATLCDVDNVVLQERAADFEKKYNKKVKIEQDLRKVYEDKDIDAVSIATPNHWHALGCDLGMSGRKGCVCRKTRLS
jgi:hypothetical protein